MKDEKGHQSQRHSPDQPVQKKAGTPGAKTLVQKVMGSPVAVPGRRSTYGGSLQAKTSRAGKTTILDRYILSSTVKIAQSQEDGTCGLARAAFDPDAKGGDFFGPDAEKRVGPALRLPPERDPAGEAILWEASLKATGIDSFFA